MFALSFACNRADSYDFVGKCICRKFKIRIRNQVPSGMAIHGKSKSYIAPF